MRILAGLGRPPGSWRATFSVALPCLSGVGLWAGLAAVALGAATGAPGPGEGWGRGGAVLDPLKPQALHASNSLLRSRWRGQAPCWLSELPTTWVAGEAKASLDPGLPGDPCPDPPLCVQHPRWPLTASVLVLVVPLASVCPWGPLRDPPQPWPSTILGQVSPGGVGADPSSMGLPLWGPQA